jgi:lipopolysaccharide transport system permease protein
LLGESGSLRDLFRDTWRSRELIATLARKEFLVRYRRAFFGVLWALAIPLMQAGVLALVIPKLARFHTPGSYLLFVLSGTVSWTFFMSTITQASTSIVDNQSVTTRVYFPRSVLPISAVLSNLYSFVPTMMILGGITIATGHGGWRLLLLVPASLAACALTAALAIVLAALHVYFRDIRYVVQAALLVWFYITPVIYPLTAVAGIRRWLEINPVTGVVELFRVATIGADSGWLPSLWWMLGWTATFLISAVFIHRRFDRVFVDLL